MLQNKLFKTFFCAIVVSGAVYMIDNIFHLFYSIMWFDMVMHFLGGFSVSMFALLILIIKRKNFSYGQMLFWGVTSAFVFGIIWELFELYFGMTYLYSHDYIGDNGMDVTMDVTGGLLAVWYGYYKLRNFKTY